MNLFQKIRTFINSKSGDGFDSLALEVFRFQASQNPAYRQYLHLLGKDPRNVSSAGEIPFFPVECFRMHQVISGRRKPALIFQSSGTTGAKRSKHYLAEPDLYKLSYLAGFHRFYGDLREFCVMALLPVPGSSNVSSLTHMVAGWIQKSGHPLGGFYDKRYKKLATALQIVDKEQTKGLLFAPSYFLLDFARSPYARGLFLRKTFVMETGGMKGRRSEMVREELHRILCRSLGVAAVHSEYGMTELLSQAYSTGNGLFRTPPWMRVMVRDMNDPFSQAGSGRAGGINVIDLANLYSCSFLATQDIGRMHGNIAFEVLGRYDVSETRGCNLMVG